jgi:hypothetical protein
VTFHYLSVIPIKRREGNGYSHWLESIYYHWNTEISRLFTVFQWMIHWFRSVLENSILYLGDRIYEECSYFLSRVFAYSISQITRAVYLIASKKQRFISSQIWLKQCVFSAMCNLSCNVVYFIDRVTFALQLWALYFFMHCSQLGWNTSSTYTFLFLSFLSSLPL